MENEPRSTAEIQDDIGSMILGDEPDNTEDNPSTEDIDSVEASPDEPEATISDDEGDSEGSEDEAVEADPEGDEAPEFVEMEIDGQLYEIPVQLKDHVLRQQDYTQKTQEVAEQRKAVEVVHAEIQAKQAEYAFMAEVQPDLTKAEQLKAQVDQARDYLREKSAELDVATFQQYQFGIAEAEREIAEISNSISKKQTEFQQAREQSIQELLNKGTEVLRSKIPSWGDEHQKQVRDYALSSGFTEQEISSVVDPRQVEVLWKASQYDALQQSKAAVVKKVQNAPTIKPKSRNPMPQETRDKLDYRKKIKSPNLSAKDKERLMVERFGEQFG